jgi:hypothetical protein
MQKQNNLNNNNNNNNNNLNNPECDKILNLLIKQVNQNTDDDCNNN